MTSFCYSVKHATPSYSKSLKTPQRSILRQAATSAKKRRVAFAEEDDDGTDSDSSTSQLMEIEVKRFLQWFTHCKYFVA